MPIYNTATFDLKRQETDEQVYDYSRSDNPTRNALETIFAEAENGYGCVCTNTGISAIALVFETVLKTNDHVLIEKDCYGGTYRLLNILFEKNNITAHYADFTNLNEVETILKFNKIKLVVCESPTNPSLKIVDIEQLGRLAKNYEALFAVDNCFCTPVLQQPIKFGADLVLYSATKYIDGQGRALGGAVVGKHDLLEEINGVIRTLGNSMSPFNAWIFLKGLETLSIRMKAHCENAQILAEWLHQHEKVEKVYYAGLPDHPGHELAKKQQKGFGGVVSFVVKGERQGAWTVIDNTRFLSITSNLGDVKSTITHPATTSHGRMSAEAKQAAGIEEGLIRVSVGLEDINDIIRDLSRGLDLI